MRSCGRQAMTLGARPAQTLLCRRNGSLRQRNSKRAGGVRPQIVDACAQKYVLAGHVDLLVDLQAYLLHAGVELGVKVDVAFGDQKVQRSAFAIVGEEDNFNVAVVGSILSGIELEVLRRDGEV